MKLPALDVAVVLGSGLAKPFKDHAAGFAPIGYDELGGLPEPTALGHVGEVLVGSIAGKNVAVFCGRFHLYEGRNASEVVSLVELAIDAGAATLVLTNAAGGLRREYAVGDLMILRDHLNLTGEHPVLDCFVDMRDAYDPVLRAIARDAAARTGVRAHEGVYAGLFGPSFETPAEVAMLRTLGADAVGMSTVLETIAARARNVRVLGISLITNVHNGEPTSALEVIVAADRASAGFAAFLNDVLSRTGLATP
jgi:purine-nucleoside phosphorylase